MTRPRKKYRRKYSDEHMRKMPLLTVKAESQEPLPDNAAFAKKATLHEALRDLEKGIASIAQYNDLAEAANVATILAERGLGSWARQDIRACVRYLVQARAHHEKMGRFVIDAEGLRLVGEMIAYREEVLSLEAYTEGFESKAALIALSRIKEGHVLRPEHLTQQVSQ